MQKTLAPTTAAPTPPKTRVDAILGSKRGQPRIDGADGLSVALVFSRNRAALERLEAALDKQREFTAVDTARFTEIMNELYYDSPIHFGSNSHWLAIRSANDRDDPVPRAVARVFRRNPAAARALLEEMARSWTSDDAKTLGNTGMTNETVLKQVEAMRAAPENVMRFIGARYAAGRHHQAALALRHAQRLARAMVKTIDKAQQKK